MIFRTKNLCHPSVFYLRTISLRVMKHGPLHFALLLILSGSLSLVSCTDSEGASEEITEAVQDLSNTFGDRSAQLPALSADAESVVSNWSVFDDLSRDLGSINGVTVLEMRAKTDRLKMYTDSLAKSIPDTLNTQPILSRLLILQTRVNLLDQQINQSRLDSAMVEDHIHELNKAGTNLFSQLNEKFLKDRINKERREDEEKELEKQQRFLDSVYQAELEDQEN